MDLGLHKTGEERKMTRRHYFCRRAPKKPTAKAITQDKSHAALGAIAYVTFALLLLFVLFQFVGCGLGSPGSEEETPGNSENQISGMEIGDVQILNFAGGLANLEFLDGNSNQRYVLALTGGLGGMDLNLQPGTSGGNPPSAPQASGDSESADDDDQDENPAISSNPATAQPPHDWFRKQEIQMLQTGKIGGAIGFHPNNDFLGLGTPENFNVLTDVNTNFSTISTTRVGMGSLVNIYLDNSTTATLTPEQLLDLTETLDNLSALLMNLLGPSSDINGNGKVDIVLSPMLETFGNNNPLSGYFWAGDLTPSNQQAASNEREVIFLVAPDSSSF
jgi:hypothetical protein